ncbi:hypothetical protein Pyn_34441 [Prunus yedoensis var. nudiflora]|uniref:Uncharacterized protein n=1 Tax=Prunus yedoensis var. nudiflora TaxID=2094558 RepID=A0A314Y4X9_PRUYE|nr:hypothetical protein Pyn_34441 [Prunus yedoensis var. nudiflora]
MDMATSLKFKFDGDLEKHKEAVEKKSEHVTLIDNWNNMHMHRGKGIRVNEAAKNKGDV